MKKIISFALWGDNPKYTTGAIKNANISKEFYPDWISRFYIHKDVDISIINEIKSIQNTEISIVNENPDWKSMFWRFLPVFDNDTECFICRDCDSRLSDREVAAVNEWSNSDKLVHIMRDHPWHRFVMLGGMIGFKKEAFEILINSLRNFNPTNEYGTDYVFFDNVLYPQVKGLSLVHDEFFEKKPFPTKRKNFEFVGEVYDENDQRNQEHLSILKQHGN
jgi:protein O-GlcNAc transferase